MTPQERARAVRDRLMNPPNAVVDQGIDLKRIPVGWRYIERTLLPLPIPPVSKDLRPPTRVEIVKSILTAVGEYFGYGILDLTGIGRRPRLAHARHIAIYLLTTHTSLSSSAIGEILNRDHSSVLYGRDKIRALVESGPPAAAMIKVIEAKI